jgi:plastocyanin
MKLKILLIPLVATAALLGVNYASAGHVPATRTINVGGGGSGVSANDFFPDEVTIVKGDTLRFTNPYEEIHTTTYVPGTPQPMAIPDFVIPNPSGPGVIFNPLAFNPSNAASTTTVFDPHAYYNSGVMFADGSSSDVVFDTPGNFKFLCLVHPGMELNVDVKGTPVTIATQADLDKKGDAQRDAFIASGKAIAADAPLTKVTDASGASTWSLLVGATQGQTDVMQFLPPGATNISTGDSVKWSTITETPHTVTFGTQVNPIMTFGQNTGFNPAAALPSGGSSYSGGDANSGLMDASGQLPGGTSYSLMFTKAGTYTYVCLLHSDQGMAGTIVVSDKAPAAAPGTGTIKAPNTGTGGTSPTGGSLLPAFLILGLAGVALAAAGARAAVKEEA